MEGRELVVQPRVDEEWRLWRSDQLKGGAVLGEEEEEAEREGDDNVDDEAAMSAATSDES